MTKPQDDDHIEFDNCTVIEPRGGGFYLIKTLDGFEILCKLKGKMKLHSIRVVSGDKVKVSASKYDMKQGFISKRYP